MSRLNSILVWFAILALFLSMVVVACGDDDDDDDLTIDDDDETGVDNDDDDDSGGDDDGDPSNPDVWSDSSSGLMWENASNVGDTAYSWDEANSRCANLTLAGYGDWRLPSISELRGLIMGCAIMDDEDACGVTDECAESDCFSDDCYGCDGDGDDGPTDGCYWLSGLKGNCGLDGDGNGNFYFSSTTENAGERVWEVGFLHGGIDSSLIESATSLVRCVR